VSTAAHAGAQLSVSRGSTRGTLRVEAVFHGVDEPHADTIAAEMIGRAHELANLPESECDVDVSVQLSPPEDPGAGCDGAR
jgi:hypothetical protein